MCFDLGQPDVHIGLLRLFQFVPLIVDLCTQIVEARGLELTGVYRIPGNIAAVTTLQHEFDKVPIAGLAPYATLLYK